MLEALYDLGPGAVFGMIILSAFGLCILFGR